jgi:aminoglycoside phosphotransferase (APT) family kinase protein
MTLDIAPMLLWAAEQVGSGAEVVNVQKVKKRGPWLVDFNYRGQTLQTVLKAGSREQRVEFVNESAGLTFSESHGLPAPRLIAADLEANDGTVALLMTKMDGSGVIPRTRSPKHLRAVGATAARLHQIPLEPRDDLPLRLRHTPWVDFSEERMWALKYQSAGDANEDVLNEMLTEHPGWEREEARRVLSSTTTTPVMRIADERLRELAPPEAETVFVHGDLWQGNTMWTTSELVGFVDWEGAGAGYYGVDLGCLRWDATLLFGSDAADEILVGWEEAMGQEAELVAYWDLVSALNTPADIGALLSPYSRVGRDDLDAETLTSRHEAFLTTTLEQLGMT